MKLRIYQQGPWKDHYLLLCFVEEEKWIVPEVHWGTVVTKAREPIHP